jgi:hypothetical protein
MNKQQEIFYHMDSGVDSDGKKEIRPKERDVFTWPLQLAGCVGYSRKVHIVFLLLAF